MRLVLVVLVFCAAAVGLAWWLSGLPGTIILTLGSLTIQTSTAVVLVVLAVALLLLLIILRAIRWALGTGTRTGRWQRRKRREGGDSAVTGSLVALAAGDATRARREAERARRLLGDTPQTLLLAAQSARLAGEEGAAAALYGRLANRPDSALLGLRGLLRQAVARQDWQEAAAIAGKAEAASPGSPWLREERSRLAARSGDWNQALALAAPEAPRGAFAVAAADAAPSTEEGLRLARGAWKAYPGFAPAALAYARRLREANKENRALEVLRTAWSRAPQPDLAALALTTVSDPAERVRRAGRIVSGKPDDAESHLLLARLQLDAGELGAARRHLETARRDGLDQRRVWVLLADLEAREGGDTETARLAQRDALRRAAAAPADPSWRCEACGTSLPEWRPACPVCHAQGRVAWVVAPAPELLPPAEASRGVDAGQGAGQGAGQAASA